VAGFWLAGVGAASAADQLTIVSWGGAYSESQRKAYYEPYMAKTGAKITEEEYNGEIAKVRAMVETNNVTWDVVDIDSQTAIQGCAEGIFEVIDWAKLGYDRKNFVGDFVSDCSVPTIVYSTIIAYDESKMPNGPTKIADVFDLEKFPGKRALQKSPFVNLEWALIADGVAIADVYDVLATEEGVNRAFAKLDTIKSEVIWWEAGAQPPQMLADGQVAITSAWNGRIYGAVAKENKPFKIVWDAQAFDWDLWGIPAGTKNLDAAYAFLKFASSPEAQADQTNYISYGPANKDALDKVNPEILPHLPTAPVNSASALVVNPQFWGDRGEELRERFSAWLAQ
jgi:putative spermidine/putrescine transport system substrate-binding protein